MRVSLSKLRLKAVITSVWFIITNITFSIYKDLVICLTSSLRRNVIIIVQWKGDIIGQEIHQCKIVLVLNTHYSDIVQFSPQRQIMSL